MLKKLNRETASSKQTRPIKVLQFGEGNFLRAFVDWIVDILNEKTDFNGAVQIIQPIREGMGEVINSQEGLYHVILNGIKNGIPSRETRLITSVAGAINPYKNYDQYLNATENPDLKFIVSNTTEAGITFSGSDNSPEILPNTFPGKLTVFLYHRYQFFNGSPECGLAVMPCELIEKNGDNLRDVILKYISHWNLSDGFREWLTKHNFFFNTFVDRIVPGFPRETIQEIYQAIGYEDRLVVMAEPFHLWVIEAPESFQELFPVRQAGLQVIFVKDLSPYRTRKVRILNGAHTALVPVAYLNGFRTVRESIEDPLTGSFIRNSIFDEIIPTLDLPGAELRQFAGDVIERFQNPFIKHELISIALNSISKFKVRVLPSIVKYIETKKQMPGKLLFSLAALIRFYKGEWHNEIIPLNDAEEIVEFFREVWKNESLENVSRETLSNILLWGEDLTRIKGFTDAVSGHLRNIENQNIGALLANLNKTPSRHPQFP